MIKNFIFYWPDEKVIYIPIHKNGSSFTDVFIEKLNYLNVDLNHIVLGLDYHGYGYHFTIDKNYGKTILNQRANQGTT